MAIEDKVLSHFFFVNDLCIVLVFVDKWLSKYENVGFVVTPRFGDNGNEFRSVLL